MKIRLLASVALMLAAPADAALIFTGVLSPNTTLQLELPGLAVGETTRFYFEWDGGTPDGGSLVNENHWVRTGWDQGILLGRDGDDTSYCEFPVGDAYAGACRGGVHGVTATSSFTSNSIEAFFTVPAGYNRCDVVTVGDCAEEWSTRRPSQLMADFVGPQPTSYRIEWGIANAVPEPSTWAMMLLGFGGMGFAIRRTKRTNTAFATA